MGQARIHDRIGEAERRSESAAPFEGVALATPILIIVFREVAPATPVARSMRTGRDLG